MTHQPRQLRRFIERGGSVVEAPNSARRHRPTGNDPEGTEEDAVGGWVGGGVARSPSRGAGMAGGGPRREETEESIRARQRFRSAVHVVQATHRWRRQTQDAQSGRPWADTPHIKPHLLVRSARYKKLRRQLAAKERKQARSRKEEQQRLRREEDQIVQASGGDQRDAAVRTWLVRPPARVPASFCSRAQPDVKSRVHTERDRAGTFLPTNPEVRGAARGGAQGAEPGGSR